MVLAVIVPSWQDTFVDLHGADTLDRLWTVLLVPHGIRASAAWDEPFSLFRRVHEADGEGAAMTAALLCTDHRWRRGAHRLVNELAGSGLLDQRALDQLAEWFLGDEVVLSVPRDLFEGHVVLVVTEARDVEAVPPVAVGEDPGIDRVAVRRGIWPPLRRWAAGHAVGRSSRRWRKLLDTAGHLRAQDGAAMAAGVMDAADHVHPGERREVLEAGLAWGSGTVRLAALPGFARLMGAEAARARASADPSATVRAWATRSAAVRSRRRRGAR